MPSLIDWPVIYSVKIVWVNGFMDITHTCLYNYPVVFRHISPGGNKCAWPHIIGISNINLTKISIPTATNIYQKKTWQIYMNVSVNRWLLKTRNNSIYDSLYRKKIVHGRESLLDFTAFVCKYRSLYELDFFLSWLSKYQHRLNAIPIFLFY